MGILSRGRLIAQGSVQDLLRQSEAVRFKSTDDARAAEVVSAIPWAAGVRTEGGYVVVTGPPERSWEVTAALAKEGVYVSEMAPVQVSLERYFLQVTGDEETS